MQDVGVHAQRTACVNSNCASARSWALSFGVQRVEPRLQPLGIHQPHAGVRGVVRFERARRARCLRFDRCFNRRVFVQHRLAARGLELRARQHARAQQHGLATRAIDDGGFDADRARPTVEYQQVLAEFFLHVQGGGRADAAKAVGAGAGQAGAAGCEQGQCHRVRGAAQADRVLPAGRSGCHAGAARQYQRERAGPEGRHQSRGKVWHFAGVVGHLRGAGHMHDQRMLRRPTLGGKNQGYCGIVGRIGTQAVHRLGWKADQAALANALGRFGYRLRVAAGANHSKAFQAG